MKLIYRILSPLVLLSFAALTVGETTYLACQYGNQTSYSGCPGPNPQDPSQCSVLTWSGNACASTTTHAFCTATQVIATVQLQRGTCVGTGCVLYGSPEPFQTAVASCTVG